MPGQTPHITFFTSRGCKLQAETTASCCLMPAVDGGQSLWVSAAVGGFLWTSWGLSLEAEARRGWLWT